MAESLYQQVIVAHRRTLDRLIDRGSVERLRNVYEKAAAEVLAKLERLGRGSTSFTAHHLHMALAQLKAGQLYIGDQMLGELNAATREAQTESLHMLVRDYTRLERHFVGHSPVLPIEEAARFAGVIDQSRGSLLRQHKTSINRYGMEVIGKTQDALALSAASGETLDGAIGRVHEAMQGEWWQAERIARCLPGETLVSGAVVRAAFRRWYEGAMVEVVTESGSKLTATPNHPMLTRRGWIRQGSIVKGDYLVSHRRQQDSCSPGNEDVARRPTTIAEIFDAVSAVGIRERRIAGQPDFHGDGIEGDVDIARPNGELVYGIFVSLTQPTAEHVFSPANGAAARFCPCCNHLRSYEGSCFCRASDLNSSGTQAFVDEANIEPKCISDLGAAFARVVPSLDFVDRDENLFLRSISAQDSHLVGLGQRAHSSSLRHVPVDRRPRYPEPGGNLPAAEAGDIEFDRVLDIHFRKFSGHVFNLSTPYGYYATNVCYTGNTESCYGANVAHSDGIKEIAKEDPALLQQWVEFCGPDGRPLDDRVGVDSIAIHGEVTDPGGEFTMPATAPFPDAKGNTIVSPSLVGQSWAVPPCRPNGREAVMPWRKDLGAPGWRYKNGRRVPA